MNKMKSVIFSSLMFAPMLAFAQPSTTYLVSLLDQVKILLNRAIPLLITIAILFFFWELVQFIRNQKKGDAKEADSAKNGLIWSLVAIFIMLSFLGIIRLFQGVVNVDNSGGINSDDYPVVL